MDVGAGDGVGAEVGGTASGVQAIATATKALSKMRAACSLIQFIGAPLCAARVLWIPADARMNGTYRAGRDPPRCSSQGCCVQAQGGSSPTDAAVGTLVIVIREEPRRNSGRVLSRSSLE